MVALMETAGGSGAILGPVCGLFTFNAVGFAYTFFIYGGLMAPIAFLSFCMPSVKKLRQA